MPSTLSCPPHIWFPFPINSTPPKLSASSSTTSPPTRCSTASLTSTKADGSSSTAPRAESARPLYTWAESLDFRCSAPPRSLSTNLLPRSAQHPSIIVPKILSTASANSLPAEWTASSILSAGKTGWLLTTVCAPAAHSPAMERVQQSRKGSCPPDLVLPLSVCSSLSPMESAPTGTTS